ncbi:DNA-directed RNA polymerase sigma-70 factor [Nocardioides psychrotolerans]|uniref:RNA polymerase sigma-70 factor, ECF subfamily n=1 Tax=Nocardioides psychrotolerans TaxID=1005945 RepID=A0A1I3HAU9_9ACTN|nr:sigma-70 family RNA polymerase sigma factor [Nocardioides psychrotolerans]GEP37685.1 DNA-directed RNA polymerase sigma-70 factor [Nocardioides psychrotolerans]SFI32687.1 RNA polymerase sigma-70 factor, ECF subfamily [Nocardioides psychrotolerans]
MGRAITTTDFEELYDATVRDVLAYARRRTSRDGEDLVAEVYAVAWRRRSDLPAPMLRRAWLFGVARNLLKADGRQHRREGELVSELAARPEPASQLTSSDRTARVMGEALERLAPTDREILRLAAWESLTPAELAVALGIRPGTARVRLHRARQALASDPEVRALVQEPDQSFLTTS